MIRKFLLLTALLLSVRFVAMAEPSQRLNANRSSVQLPNLSARHHACACEELSPNCSETEPGDKSANTPFKGREIIAFKFWVLRNMELPAEKFTDGYEGTVLVSFTVNKKGKVTNVVALPGSDEALAPYVVAQLAKSPAWTPSQSNGRPVENR